MFIQMKGHAFLQGDIIAKMSNYIEHIKIFFSRSTGIISSKLGTKHPWRKGIQVCSNEGPRLSPRRDKSKIAKLY